MCPWHVFLLFHMPPLTGPLYVPVAKMHDPVFVPQTRLADADRHPAVQRALLGPKGHTSEVRLSYPIDPKPTVCTIREPFLHPINGPLFVSSNTPLVRPLPVST